MPQALSTNQIQQHIDNVNAGGVVAARQVYADLYAKGYNYAGWANGVASGNSITGQSALDYLSETAMMGLGGPACRNLTQQQIDNIRVDMSLGYLGTLKQIALDNGGQVTRENNWSETKQFHKDGLEKNSLGLDNWTLQTPMDLIAQERGDAAAEAAWQKIRDTGGSGWDAIAASTGLLNQVGRSAFSPDPAVSQKAQDWMNNVPGPTNWQQLGKFADAFAKSWSETFSEWGEAISNAVSNFLGTTPDPQVKTIRYVDPLILDLDGDGLEITPLSKNILFDADGDTIKTGTAWTGSDDGFVVWDRNGNGTIDKGAELFGDETILANGQKASNGFTALAEQDSNKDGKFDASDAQYANLRIWRDLNQDAISQANELTGLAASGVKSISLTSTTTNTNFGDAVLFQNGTFTRTDNSTGQAGSFILAQNSFNRQFTPITVSDAAKALPNISGSGMVRDLQEAATLSPELIALLNQAKNSTTRAAYKDAVAALIREWGNDSVYNSASKQALAEGYGLIMSDPVNAQECDWMDKAIKASEADRNAFRATLGVSDLAKFDDMRVRMVGKLENVHAYEAFTGHSFLNWSRVKSDAFNWVMLGTPNGGVPVEMWVPLSQILRENRNAEPSSQAGYIRVTIPSPPAGLPHVDTLWNRLIDDASNNMLPTLRLSKYLDMVDLTISGTGVNFNFDRLNAGIAAVSASSTYEGAALFLDMHSTYGDLLDGMGWDGVAQLRTLMQRGLVDNDVRNAFTVTGFNLAGAGINNGGDGNDVFAGDSSNNTFYGNAGDDLLDGLGGQDNLSGGVGDDVLYGGDGIDTLYGEDGADTLDGGAGNDNLSGGRGADVYLFGKGSGQDSITNYDADALGTNADTIQLGAGIAAGDVTLTRAYEDLIISINGTTDTLRVHSYFNADGTSSYAVENIKFADTANWNIAANDMMDILVCRRKLMAA